MMTRTLKSQLILITLLPVLITLVFISTLFIKEFSHKLASDDELRAHDIAAQASMMSEFYLYTGDVDGLEQVSQSLIRIEDLHYVRFINNSGQLLMQKGYSQGLNTQQYVFPIYAAPVELDDFTNQVEPAERAQLGTIEIGLSRNTGLDQNFQAYQRLFFIAFTALLLGILLILFFTRVLSHAIDNLALSAKAIGHGKLSTRCKENGSGELLEFQRLFNKMAASFEASETKLKAEVDAATASLLLTIDELSHKNDELDKSRQETIALERCRAISEERTRIMKDMHDGIGGQLVASLALLEQEKDTQLKENIREILTECLDDLRLIINSLNIANDGLAALLADFKYRMNKKLEQMNISLVWRVADVADNIHLPPQMSLHLLRILQETFTNILKHANASKIHFEFTDEGENIQFLIIDDGNFDVEQANKNGIGMASMRSRANAMDAILTIQQAESGGCETRLSIPKTSLPHSFPANEG